MDSQIPPLAIARERTRRGGKHSSLGLTLVELIVCMSMLAILIGLAIPSFSNVLSDWRRDSAIRDFSLTEARRINDFIQAGYTGGGRGFSVQTAEEIRSVFDSVLSDILNAAGSDAGIEMESPESGVKTLDGSLKYGVEFRTVDNSGDVKATQLDADGNGLKQDKDINGNLLHPASANYWAASKQVQDHTERRIFSMGFGITPFEFKGSFADLPVDVQVALKTGKDNERIPNDSRFVDYLRGKDPVSDAQSRLFRPRLSPIGAIVNAPPLLMGDEEGGTGRAQCHDRDVAAQHPSSCVVFCGSRTWRRNAGA